MMSGRELRVSAQSVEKGTRGPHSAGTWDKTLKGAIPGREKTSDSKEDLGGDTENPWRLVLRNTVCFLPSRGILTNCRNGARVGTTIDRGGLG